jgi:hypothetical protein
MEHPDLLGTAASCSLKGTMSPSSQSRQGGASCKSSNVRNAPIVLQKSKVAGHRIFAKNPKREAIADSYNLNRATEVAYEFNVRR